MLGFVARRHVSVIANDIKRKMVIEHKGGLWKVVKTPTSTRSGARGAAYVQVEMKEITKGTKLNERFRSSEKVEQVSLTQNRYQFLYTNPADGTLEMMNPQTFEQVVLSSSLLDFPIEYLEDGTEVSERECVCVCVCVCVRQATFTSSQYAHIWQMGSSFGGYGANPLLSFNFIPHTILWLVYL
jgi:translation elongation factor P/translation initiation factor 5A